MESATKLDLAKTVEVRSFLAGNLDVLLENLNVRKQASKNESEDLFNFDNDETITTKIPWKKDFEPKSVLEVLIQEKESLGLYVTGNPLNSYSPFFEWVKFASGRNDIYLVLINKIKKIFTKTGKLMLALQISTLDGEYEGIIFPKKALELSSKITDKGLFWARGKILENRKKEEKIVTAEEEQSSGENNEYEESPKIAIDNIISFDHGLLDLITKEDNLSNNRMEMLNQVDWESISKNPEEYEEFLNKKTPKTNESEIKILKLPKALGPQKLQKIKEALSTEPTEYKNIQIKLEVETNEGWKTAKGQFWVSPQEIRDIWSK